MARRKQSCTHTTISVKWEDKELFRKYAKSVKETKNGIMNESDSALFHRILEEYKQNHPLEENATAKKTYPEKPIIKTQLI